MPEFIIRFLFSNIVISFITIIFLIIKRLLKTKITSRIQYNLWFVFLALLVVPFIPLKPIGISEMLLWIREFSTSPVHTINNMMPSNADNNIPSSMNWVNDFTLSVSSKTPSITGFILCLIWFIGIITMLFLLAKSKSRLNTLKRSALPLQNKAVRKLYKNCLDELQITKDIPIFSTAFLKSPIIVGWIKPFIYLPIHLISDYKASDIRYMLLHELQHYKHNDALTNHIMNLTGVLYWFNPAVWYALKEMRNDREIACDVSVLELLDESSYEDYGNTLINFAEKVSLNPFPYATGLSGTMKQMQQRILNISSYKKPSVWKKAKGLSVFGIITAALFALAPILSTYAAEQNHYNWKYSSKNVNITDMSAYFNEYDGSFVLYDTDNNTWSIYNMDYATLRSAPESTYKIYDALFGLEEGIITPDNSFIAWDGTEYPFDAWNADQTLYSAMGSSVNWYFHAIDKKLGTPAIRKYVQDISYGNEIINTDLASYWMQSDLKISPIEQVELLMEFYNNSFEFTPKNINVVKDSICLFTSENNSFYGKTGTGRVDGQDVNGWFIGFIETNGNTYFFATNIQNNANATGSNATEITMKILSDMNIWIQ